MTPQEALQKMRGWIEAEIQRSKKPYQDPFTLTSLVYCASKAVGPEHLQASEDALARLRSITLANNMPRHDVFDPAEALALIEQALTQAN